MDFEYVISILLVCASLSVGMLFGALRSKLLVSKTDNKLHYAIYGVSIIVVLIVLFSYVLNFSEFMSPFHWYANTISLLALLSSIALALFTKKYLVHKSIYKVEELDPIINDFTSMADRSDIKLFGGDLNFFGNTPSQMDTNSQYNHLKSTRFNSVYILCEVPDDSITQIRYGKLFNEIPNLKMRYYYPQEADLRVRGRIIKVDGSSKLLMYTKHSHGKYRALETDTANSGGALYNNIWDLAWSLAKTPSDEQIKEYVGRFKG